LLTLSLLAGFFVIAAGIVLGSAAMRWWCGGAGRLRSRRRGWRLRLTMTGGRVAELRTTPETVEHGTAYQGIGALLGERLRRDRS
jgi:hypothetical protein